MVKNSNGGNRHKKVARKHYNAMKAPSRTRLANPKEPCEMYASVITMYGQNCDVICNDGIKRTCVIRKKFKGRNKRNNIITTDTKVLVGLREWEKIAEGKKQKCDLLEVYEKKQHHDLMSDPNCNWDKLLSDLEKRGKNINDDTYEFHDNIENVDNNENIDNNIIISNKNSDSVSDSDSDSESFNHNEYDDLNSKFETNKNNIIESNKIKKKNSVLDDINDCVYDVDDI